MGATDINRVIDAIWRIESAKLIAGLTRITRDVGLSEEFAHDALVSAIEQWPGSGVPENPGAWLMATSKRRAIDAFRRSKRLRRTHEEIGRKLEAEQAANGLDSVPDLDDEVGDDLLRLIFMTCHPVLSADARVALTLRLLGGLSTEEIARGFLVSEQTIAQRIVRAKKTLTTAGVPFEVPRGADREARLASVLEVIYLIFNEGYSATTGNDLIRPALCEDALRLGRILAELAPGDSEVHGLVALMEIQASRARARVSPNGDPILLLDQDRARWDRLLIHRGFRAIERANRTGSPPGFYLIQASIAACHARAVTPDQTDWSRIAGLYDELAMVAPSPVVELNRAMAVSMAYGPERGLELVDALAEEPSLRGYHLLPSVRADLLFKLGRLDEAKRSFEHAASLTKNDRERAMLLDRAGACIA